MLSDYGVQGASPKGRKTDPYETFRSVTSGRKNQKIHQKDKRKKKGKPNATHIQKKTNLPSTLKYKWDDELESAGLGGGKRKA